jgi:hypothetical protein
MYLKMSSLIAERDQLSQTLSVTKMRLQESDDSRWEAVESSQKTDVMWREIEVE